MWIIVKTVLVTGGAGFIGSHVVDKLIQEKYNVVIFDNLSSGTKKNVHPDAFFIKGDVFNPNDIDAVFAQKHIDIIFHIAGQPSIINSFTNPQQDFNTNFSGTMNMVMASLKHRISRFLYASSMTAYGNPVRLPIKETDPCVPISYYGIAKYAAERFVHATADKNDLETPLLATSFRMFNVYGPLQSLTNPYQGVLAIFMGNVLRAEPITIYGDGKQARDFIFVGDVADTWVRAIANKKSYGEVFNIGSGKQTSMRDLAHLVIKACGLNPKTYPVHYKKQRPGDQRFVEADTNKAKELLSFNPETSLDIGLKLTLDWAKHSTS